MQHHICTALYSTRDDLAAPRMKQRQQFRRPFSDVLMRLTLRLTILLPVLSWDRRRLKGPGFIFCPRRETLFFTFEVSSLN